MKKAKQIKNFLTHEAYVLSPAKTGSTHVASVCKTSGHGHSFFMERAFFYKDVRFSTAAVYSNLVIFKALIIAKTLANLLTNKKSLILIPLRQEKKRKESLLKDLLIPLASRYYFTKEYREIHHLNKKTVLNFYRSKINDNGVELWCKSHGFEFQKIKEISENISSAPIIKKMSNIKIIFFNIEQFNSENFKLLLRECGIDSAEATQSNESSSLWYSEIFKDEQ